MLSRITNNWHLKLTALVLAFLFWAALRREQPYRYSFDNVPVRVVNNDPDWVLSTTPDPPAVRVTLEGPGGELLQVASEPPEIHIPVDEVTDSTMIRVLQNAWVSFGTLTETQVAAIEPATVRLEFEPIGARLLPIAFDFSGRPAEGFELAGPPIVDPPMVRASGGMRRLGRMDSLRLSLNLDNRRGVDTLVIPMDTTGTGLILSPNRVRVILPLRPTFDTTLLRNQR